MSADSQIREINMLRRKTQRLEAELATERALFREFQVKGIPMKYKRMEFNARLQKENADLRAALAKCRAHTTYWSNADRELLDGLLASIARICDAALGDRHE